MKHRIAAASLAMAVAWGYAIAGDLQSGPQVGDRVPGPFNVLNACNAENPKVNGTKTCLV
jgi:hypothetical protein